MGNQAQWRRNSADVLRFVCLSNSLVLSSFSPWQGILHTYVYTRTVVKRVGAIASESRNFRSKKKKKSMLLQSCWAFLKLLISKGHFFLHWLQWEWTLGALYWVRSADWRKVSLHQWLMQRYNDQPPPTAGHFAVFFASARVAGQTRCVQCCNAPEWCAPEDALLERHEARAVSWTKYNPVI